MYRAHITVMDPDLGRTLTVEELKSMRLAEAIAAGDGSRTWHSGQVGTRYGKPGIWVRVEPQRRSRGWPADGASDAPLRFRRQVHGLMTSLRRVGYLPTVVATNKQSSKALVGTGGLRAELRPIGPQG